MAVAGVVLERRTEALGGRLVALVGRARVPLAAFGLSQLSVLLVAVAEAAQKGIPLARELSAWDGQWYLRLAADGYPSVAPHAQSTLGFLPLYPGMMWLLAHLPGVSLLTAGLVLARVGGLVATVLVWRLAVRWWGDEAGQRAAVLFAVFPGAVVFSMVYPDGPFLALVAGCLLALDDRRWWLAGLLGALASATGAGGMVLVAACATAAGLHIHRTKAWRHHRELRCLASVALAPVGMVVFGLYLWLRVGSPLASLDAQSRYWGNHLSPLALLQHYRLYLGFDGDDATLLLGLLGVPFIIGTRYLLVRTRHRPPGPVIAWGFGMTGLSLISTGLMPNPRMLLFAFPSGIVLGRYLGGRPYWLFVGVSLAGLALVSWWTLAGSALP